MKNQIVRFLRDESGSALDDLLLLLLLIATAIFAAIAIGVALAAGIGLIVGLVFYIKFLCKLWREGKKSWAWTGSIPIVILAIFLGTKAIEAGHNYLAEQRSIKQERLVRQEQSKTAFEFWKNIRDYAATLPLTGHLKIRELGADKIYVLVIEPDDHFKEMWKQYESMPKYGDLSYSSRLQCGWIDYQNPEEWTFNGKALRDFLGREELCKECNKSYVYELYVFEPDLYSDPYFLLSGPREIEIRLENNSPAYAAPPPDLFEVCLTVEWHDSSMCDSLDSYFGKQRTKTKTIYATLQQ